MSEVKTADDMRRLLLRPIGSAIMHGDGQGFEVWHTEAKPDDLVSAVRDFTIEEEDGTKWRGSFKLAITEVEAYIDRDDDEDIDWYDDEEEEE